MATGTEKFAKKENIYVPPSIMSDMKVNIPPIYYWEDVYKGTSEAMTMAFLYKGRPYGMSYDIEDNNFVKIEMLRKKLFNVVKESLDVLVHHGDKVLDFNGDIDPRKVNDQEAIRWKFDEHWHKKVAAYNQLVKITPITREQAKKLKLL